MLAVYLQVIVNSCIKSLNLKRPWILPDITLLKSYIHIKAKQTLTGASNLALLLHPECFCIVYAKQKQPQAVKKGTASKLESIV